MLYDWKKLLDDYKKDELKLFKCFDTMYPIFDYSDMDPEDFNYMQQMVNSGLIIPIDNSTIEEENEQKIQKRNRQYTGSI